MQPQATPYDMTPPPNAKALPALHPLRPEEASFKQAMGHFPTGVTVVTALDERERLCGLTVNAFSSVSLEPPLVLVCIKHSSRSYPKLMTAGAFTIHMLHRGQEREAIAFAKSGGAREEIAPWRLSETGLPLLDSFHTALECSLHEALPGGDHSILLGRVHRIHPPTGEEGPLLYYRGALRSFEA